MHIALLGYGTPWWDVFPHPHTGRELQVWGIAEELSRRGHQVTLIKAGEEDSASVESGVEVITLRHGRSRSEFQGDQSAEMITEGLSFSRLASIKLREMRPDIMCLHYGLSSRYLTDLGIPYSYTFHVPDVMGRVRRTMLQKDFLRYPLVAFRTLMEQQSAARADSLITLNEDMRDYIHTMWKVPAYAIPCGINERGFRDHGDMGHILYAGRLDWNKNVETLVRAYALLPPACRSEHVLKLVGSGEREGAVRDLVRRLSLQGQVEIVPWTAREDLATIMGSCSVFVLPSHFETFGIVLIEAMACHKPVIASDIPGPRDCVRPGSNGFLVRPDDVRGLSVRLLRLLEDPVLRWDMGRKGRSLVETHYTFQAIGRRYEEVLRNILGEGAGNMGSIPDATREVPVR